MKPKLIEPPFIFNLLKHHLEFIANYVHENAGSDQVYEDLLLIGELQLDVYLGNLKPLEILKEIESILQGHKTIEEEDFLKMLQKNNGYKVVQLSDGSCWVLRKGEYPTCYVHVHPARNHQLTKRVKAKTLKTALLYLILHRDQNLDLQLINNIRQSLHLSPIKNAESTMRCIELIKNVNRKVE